MKTRTFATEDNSDNKVTDSTNDQKTSKYKSWIKKVQELNEMNRAYYLRIHSACEALCA